MKKLAICLMMTCLSLTLLPLQLNAATTDKPSSLVVTKPPEPVESAEVKALLKRVEVINAVDKSKLSSNETKKQVEVLSTGRHHRHGGVVYVSAGAIILIIILVVILL
jgi:hypothetical protein